MTDVSNAHEYHSWNFDAYDRWNLLVNPIDPAEPYLVPAYVRVEQERIESFLNHGKPGNQIYIEWYEQQILRHYLSTIQEQQVQRKHQPTDANTAIIEHVYAVVYLLKNYDELSKIDGNISGLNHFYVDEIDGKPLYKILHLGRPLPRGIVESRLRSIHPISKPHDTYCEAIVGIIDDGIAHLNDRFCRTTNDLLTTRFDSIWLQGPLLSDNASSHQTSATRFNQAMMVESDLNSDSQPLWGKVYYRDQINQDLSYADEAAIYRRINKELYPGEHYQRGGTNTAKTHGTHITDVACGASSDEVPEDLETGRPDLDIDGSRRSAKGVDIIGVSLAAETIADTSGTRLEFDVLQGLRWIVHRAMHNLNSGRHLPLVVNISLGILAGPKDGSGLLEKYLPRELDLYQRATGATAELVLPFGNSYENKQVAILESTVDQPDIDQQKIFWQIQPDDRSPCFLEIRQVMDDKENGEHNDGLQGTDFILTPPGAAPIAISIENSISTPTPISNAAKQMLGMVYGYYENNRRVAIIAINRTAGFDGHPCSNLALAQAGAWKISVGNNIRRLTLQVQRGETPVGYRQLGRQSYLDTSCSDKFESINRTWSSIARPLTNLGSHSAIVNKKPNVHSTAATYTRLRTLSQPHPDASWYTARAGSNDNARSITAFATPVCSSVADCSPNTTGTLAAGTMSGTTARLSGTSVAAARTTRMLLLQLLAKAQQKTSSKSVVPAARDRLGKIWHFTPTDRLTGFTAD